MVLERLAIWFGLLYFGLVSDCEIKRPRHNVVESRKLPVRPTMILGSRHPGFPNEPRRSRLASVNASDE
jgi:hypothetical protein